MKTIFRAVFYLRSNYVNKEGKTPVMLRIYLNNERLSIGSTGIAVQQSQWDSEKERLKGRTTEVLSTNLELDNIQSGLQTIFKKLEMTDAISLERIKSEYLGKKEEVETMMTLFDKHNKDIAKQVGISVSAATFQKYNVCKRHFTTFLQDKYKRSDIRLSELTYIIIHDFDIYLRTVVGQNPNTATKTMKTFKTITILGRKMGVIHHDPFLNHRFHLELVNRGFLTDEEILKIANKNLGIQCAVFAGLAKNGKGIMGWCHGFKLHLLCNDSGEVITFCLTGANVDDRDSRYGRYLQRFYMERYLLTEDTSNRNSLRVCSVKVFNSFMDLKQE